MFLTDMISWWYFKGWGVYFTGFKRKLEDTVDFFSISDMLRTLFMPYRQISAGASGEALDSKISAFFDRLISRIVGFFARLIVIFAGVIVLVLEGVVGIIVGIAWPVMPLLPVLGIILTVVGVVL